MPVDEVRAGVAALTDLQRLIYVRAGEAGGIRAVEAGMLVHRSRAQRAGTMGLACSCTQGDERACRYANADGTTALRELAKRGLVKRGPSTWVKARG